MIINKVPSLTIIHNYTGQPLVYINEPNPLKLSMHVLLSKSYLSELRKAVLNLEIGVQIFTFYLFPFIFWDIVGYFLNQIWKLNCFKKCSPWDHHSEKQAPAHRNQRQERAVENKPQLTNERLFSYVFRRSIADN